MKATSLLPAILAATCLFGCSTTKSRHEPNGEKAAAYNLALPPQESSEATQAARAFLEAIKNEDWNAVAKFWPPNSRSRFEDIFTPNTKRIVGGLQIMTIGIPYKDAHKTGVFVPYEVRFGNGETQRNNLWIAKSSEGHWNWLGGF